MLHCVKINWIISYLCNCKSEISNPCNVVKGHCLRAMKIVHQCVSSCFDWLISRQQSVNPSREAISIYCLENTKRFTFVHPVNRSNKAFLAFKPLMTIL